MGQTSTFSKISDNIDFNPKYLSNYLSAIILKNNYKSEESLKYFNSSKVLINEHSRYLKNYAISLVNSGNVKKSIKLIKQNKKNKNFFEADLLLIVENIKKKKFNENIKILNHINKYSNNEKHQYIIYEVLKSYNNLFINKKISLNPDRDFGKLSLINEAFQLCYLKKKESNNKFLNLVNSDENNYSRYLYFYLNNLAAKNELENLNQISTAINIFDSNLLIQQSKNWIENSHYNKFNKFFSCENEEDIIAEFFFLISNYLAADKKFEQSIFYSYISYYLNPKFYFNLTHLIENYFENENYIKTRKILEIFDKEDQIYYWYKLKKNYQIIYNEKGSKESTKYIENNFKKYSNPSPRIIYDMANIYRSEKKFEKSIKYYSQILDMIDPNSDAYADILYRRGSSYERLGKHKKSDEDLINSLIIKPDDPYILNYLGYSWLERDYKIDEAIEMLNKAYEKKTNSPYITDSVGWGYYLIKDFINAEKFLNKALKLMPDDPIVNDHYGDVLWKLGKKIQAGYYWKSALVSEDSDEKLKKKIKHKLLNGLN